MIEGRGNDVKISVRGTPIVGSDSWSLGNMDSLLAKNEDLLPNKEPITFTGKFNGRIKIPRLKIGDIYDFKDHIFGSKGKFQYIGKSKKGYRFKMI